jgi:hypothetical protein
LPTPPTDPFNGQTLVYARDSNRYRVYSVGRNLTDDGGSGSLSDNDQDIVFAVPVVERLAPSAVAAGNSNNAASNRPPTTGAAPGPRAGGSGSGRPPRGFVPPPFGTPVGEGFQDEAPPGGFLVGMVVIKSSNGVEAVQAIQPIYRVGNETQKGKWLGGAEGPERYEAIAKPGYAVGGIHAKRGSVIHALQLTFFRIQGNRMDKSDQYQSEWLGGDGGSGRNFIDFGGRFIQGVSGTFQGNVTSIQMHPQ